MIKLFSAGGMKISIGIFVMIVTLSFGILSFVGGLLLIKVRLTKKKKENILHSTGILTKDHFNVAANLLMILHVSIFLKVFYSNFFSTHKIIVLNLIGGEFERKSLSFEKNKIVHLDFFRRDRLEQGWPFYTRISI